MRTKFLSAAAMGLALTVASGVASAQTANQRNGDRNVYVTMSVDEEVTIQQFGPLELFGECLVQDFVTGLRVFFTSSEDG